MNIKPILKLGTHNSLSYHFMWYQWPLWLINHFFSKCQNLDYRQQYEIGVRSYDIRIRFKGNKIISGHGLMKYHIDVLDVLRWLNEKSRMGDEIYVRIVYEDSFIPKFLRKSNEEIGKLFDFMVGAYKNIKFTQCITKKHWVILRESTPDPGHKYLHKFTEGRLFSPIRCAKRDNPEYWERVDYGKINVFDFVDI